MHLAIGFAVQTAFLFVSLWVLIKLQMLHWNFLGILGASAFVTALDMLPFGHFFSFAALALCVWKLTRPDFYTDVIFTVGISYALTFCLNLFLLGALMPDLRYNSAKTELAVSRLEARARTRAAAETNSPPATNAPDLAPAAVAPNPPAKPVLAAAPAPHATNAPDPAAVLRAVTAKFSLKGISKGVNQQLATVYTGVRIYTIGVGETVDMVTSNGRLPVHCEELGENKAVLDVAGQQVTLFVMH